MKDESVGTTLESLFEETEEISDLALAHLIKAALDDRFAEFTFELERLKLETWSDLRFAAFLRVKFSEAGRPYTDPAPWVRQFQRYKEKLHRRQI